MANIIKSFRRDDPAVKPVNGYNAMGALLSGLVRAVWVTTVLVWPVLKWVLSIEVFFQLLRMFYHWNTPGVHAGWTFLAHFGALATITYFVALYKPK
jgi:hypothetical protein